MNKRRLLKLADLLEKDAKNKNGVKFDMCSWGHIDEARSPVSCGTTACAMGLAAVSGAFKRQGLGYDADCWAIHFTWKGRAIDGIPAARRLFEISTADAESFFMPQGWGPHEGAPAERHLAKRIREFVAAR